MTPAEANHFHSARHWRDWGVIGSGTARALLQLADDETMPLLGVISPARERDDARTKLELIDSDADWIEGVPFVLFRANRKQAAELGRTPGVLKIISADDGGVEATAVTPHSVPTSALISRTYHAYNLPGQSASGVPVGILESLRGCGIWDSHEAFGNLSGLSYMFPRLTCSKNVDCTPCRHGGVAANCIGGYCVDQHMHAVASRVSSSQGGEVHAGSFHAGAASLFVANGFHQEWVNGAPLMNASPSALVEAYQWLVSNGVRLVNESFSQKAKGFSSRHLIADWFARFHGLTIVQAAGNLQEHTSDREVRCGGLNTICVGGVETLRRESRPNHKFWSESLWANFYSSDGAPLQVEKPDIAAEADGDVAVIFREDYWAAEVGTSLAAPVVTGAIALFQEDCSLHRGVDLLRYPHGVRSRLKTAMRDRQNFLERDPPTNCSRFFVYPTAQFPQCDYKTGVGSMNAEHLLVWCGNCTSRDYEGECGEELSLELSPGDEGREELPDWMFEDLDGLDFDAMRSRGGVRGLRVSGGSGLRMREVFRYEDVPGGTSFRSTLSYFSCPMQAIEHWDGGLGFSQIQPGDLATAVDLDLAICGKPHDEEGPHCIYHSSSLHDSNEGFHIRTVGSYEWVSIYILEPETWSPCPNEDGTAGTSEPAFVSTIYGRGF